MPIVSDSPRLNSVKPLTLALLGVAAGIATLIIEAAPAMACGCFAPPNPSVPVVQAGERILFAMEDGEVTAHIQIQYAGDADEFAWLVPLPARPDVELGTDELFAQVINTTQPQYRLLREDDGFCDDFATSRPGGVADSAPPPEAAPSDPLVSRDIVGPYDYVVLRADSKQPMLDWLEAERFFVPAGTDEAVDPYIREGAFFLALKLRKGQSVGDLAPVVLKYRSELPMIPIVLTSVAADPDMPVMVWMLGEGRAIPRNYYHTKINDAQIDWLNNGANYVDVVTRAVDEADGRHSFVTEYAGTSAIMRGLLDPDGRFGDVALLGTIADPVAFVEYLLIHGYTSVSLASPLFPQLSSPLVAILQRHLPMPAELAEQGIRPIEYYDGFGFWLDEYQRQFPDLAADMYADFDPAEAADEIEERIVVPTLAAARLFDEYPYMTRLFTTLSPEEMTSDPVFSFNPALSDVSNIHEARLILECQRANNGVIPARIITEQGWVLRFPRGTAGVSWPDLDMPDSLQIQVLREEGAPEVTTDNESEINAVIDRHSGGGGCSVVPGTRQSAPLGGWAGLLLLTGLGWGLARRRRRV